MKKLLAVVVGFVSTAVSVAASAAYTPPAAIGTAFTDMGSAWEYVESNIWPILATVVIGLFVIRMFKRGAKQVG